MTAAPSPEDDVIAAARKVAAAVPRSAAERHAIFGLMAALGRYDAARAKFHEDHPAT